MKQSAVAAKPEPAKADPILSTVCKAFDEVQAEGKAEVSMDAEDHRGEYAA